MENDPSNAAIDPEPEPNASIGGENSDVNDALLSAANSKIDVLTQQLAERDAEITAQKAANYDLLMKVGSTVSEPDPIDLNLDEKPLTMEDKDIDMVKRMMSKE